MKKNRFSAMAAMGVGLAPGRGARLHRMRNALPQPPDGGDMMFEAMGPGPGGPPDAIEFVAFEGGVRGKTVTGAPFTASFSIAVDAIACRWQPDSANHSGSLARDSQGRTRRDMTLPAIGPWAASGQAGSADDVHPRSGGGRAVHAGR